MKGLFIPYIFGFPISLFHLPFPGDFFNQIFAVEFTRPAHTRASVMLAKTTLCPLIDFARKHNYHPFAFFASSRSRKALYIFLLRFPYMALLIFRSRSQIAFRRSCSAFPLAYLSQVPSNLQVGVRFGGTQPLQESIATINHRPSLHRRTDTPQSVPSNASQLLCCHP